MARFTGTGAAVGMAAALAMAITPVAASAAEVRGAPRGVGQSPTYKLPGTFDTTPETVQRHRDWYRYRGYHRHRHRGIDAGDVFAGVLILGGIAAIASAAESNKRDREYRERDVRYRERDYRDRDYDYRPQRGDSRYDGGRGIDNAVRMCVNEIERDVRVDSVDGVDRTGEGWRVSGALYNGEGFTCRIGPDGRISDIDYGARASSEDFSDAFADSDISDERAAVGQWSADRYAQARRTTDTGKPAARTIEADQIPAYPGGPLPGEELGADDNAASTGDDRYRTAEAPDFTG
ncbi:hypothetical protein [Altererythrobacter sp. GH1-8]|uniref:hypothetical protein n=1 Tax=Altererythrobacter sp. GH1-8 TaxID=3349333 RepID=UPI00374D0A26